MSQTNLSANATWRYATRFSKGTILAFRRWPILPGIILLILVTASIFAPWIAPYSPFKAWLLNRLDVPMWYPGGSAEHILGYDQQGRDLLSRLIFGARVSLMVAGCVIAISGTFGIMLGLISGYFGGAVDDVLMRLVELQMSIPLILVVLVLAVVFGQSFALLITLIAVWGWAGYARQTRALTLSLKNRDYVLLARVAGASTLRIILTHIFPGVINTAIVIGTLQVGGVILTEAILSFLGAGIPPPTPSWGSMVADGRVYLGTAWWIAFFPGVAIFLTVASFNFLGDWLRDYLDPRLRQLGQ